LLLSSRGFPAFRWQSVKPLTAPANVSTAVISTSFNTQSALVAEPVGVATGLLPYIGRRVMSSIDTAGSQVSESEISATVVSLRERFEAVRRGEIQRVRGRLGSLSPDQENAIDSLSHDLIERLLQAPMAMLKNASTGKQAVALVETVRRIFNLGA